MEFAWGIVFPILWYAVGWKWVQRVILYITASQLEGIDLLKALAFGLLVECSKCHQSFSHSPLGRDSLRAGVWARLGENWERKSGFPQTSTLLFKTLQNRTTWMCVCGYCSTPMGLKYLGQWDMDLAVKAESDISHLCTKFSGLWPQRS